MTPWLTVIGIGDAGLSSLAAEARSALDAADIVVGGERHLAMLDKTSQQRVLWGSPLLGTVKQIEERRGQKVAVLATGDPMWFGVGGTLARHFRPEEMRVLPGASAFSLAAARLGWPVESACCLTVHGRPIHGIHHALLPNARLLIYSADGSTPAQLAAFLCGQGFGKSRMLVLEHLGGAAERVRETIADRFDLVDVADLNMVAVECAARPLPRPLSRLAGLPDDAFRHDGKMTKRVLRAAALAALAPLPGELLWDVGAGCGSISVEWMRASPTMRALAIEPVEARRLLIAANAETLGAPDLVIIAAKAPDAFIGLEAPDGIFIGGGLADGFFDAAWRALKPDGRMVAHAVTLESEAILVDLHARFGGELMRIQVDRAEPVGPYRGWRPTMPVTHWHVTKCDEDAS